VRFTPSEVHVKVSSLTLKDKEERRIVRGHAWVYRNELQAPPALEDGTLVDVFAANRRFVGRGFFQAQGGIAARLLTRRQEDIDLPFFLEALTSPAALRARLFPGSTVYRWVFGESDGLPGVVIDRYGAVAVAHTQCAYYGTVKDALAQAVLATPGVSGLLLDVGGTRHSFGTVPAQVSIELDGLLLEVPIEGGQKTGMFLDQRMNAIVASKLAHGLSVLDGHTNVGQWACRMALGGATRVLAVDTSRPALDIAQANAQANGVGETCLFECAAIEDVLARDEHYGLIILDPPAFAKARPQSTKAMGRYQALNRAAIRRLEPGGILVSCSCSHFVDDTQFLETIKRAAISEQRQLQLLEFRGASPDHPVLVSMPETSYLKCAILRVL